MRTADVFAHALGALEHHRLRTGLTVVAVAIGAVAVLLLTALGAAARRYVVDQFASVGTNLVVVVPGRTETTGIAGAASGATHDLTLEDAEALRRALRGSTVSPMSLGSAPFEFERRRRDVYVVGSTSDYTTSLGIRVAAGVALPRGDVRSGERVVLIGPKLSREVFGDVRPLGRTVRIAGARFRVIGVLDSKGTKLGIDYDDLAIVPVRTGLRLFDQSGLNRITIQAPNSASVPGVLERARALIRDRHRDEDFTIFTQDAMISSFESILRALTLALAAIAAISLAVAGIGIMNVMLVSVSERVREVGLLKAVGAEPPQIRRLFLAEAMLLSGFGAVVGIATSLLLMRLAATLWPALPIRPSLGWIAVVFGLSIVAGSFFGWMPARRASILPPVDALRGRISA